ncbi:MAG: nucleoside deaminase [Sphingomonadales bacterium]
MIDPYNDEYFMRQALIEANKGLEKKEVPVGAVVVSNKQIIARAHNLTEQLTDVTAHAEIQAITAAAQFIGAKHLKNCTMYVTLEPCKMCAGALYWSQIDKVVFSVRDESRGAGLFTPSLYHPTTLVVNGILKEECRTIIQQFFQKKRKSAI